MQSNFVKLSPAWWLIQVHRWTETACGLLSAATAQSLACRPRTTSQYYIQNSMCQRAGRAASCGKQPRGAHAVTCQSGRQGKRACQCHGRGCRRHSGWQRCCGCAPGQSAAPSASEPPPSPAPRSALPAPQPCTQTCMQLISNLNEINLPSP